MTSIKVPAELRDRVSRLAAKRHLSQHAYLDQLVQGAEEAEFWSQMARASATEYAEALAEDGDVLNEDFALEDAALGDES